MSHPIKHAQNSVRKFGGKAEDYLSVHHWFDESKAFFPDFRHRELRHHAEGIFLCERVFGIAITNGAGDTVSSLYRRTACKGRSRTNSDSPGLARSNPTPAMGSTIYFFESARAALSIRSATSLGCDT